jgi:hypothetical protein
MRNPTIPPGVFTEVEEEFFRAGARLDREASDAWDELEGRPRRAATETGIDDEDDWEWEIAIARARADAA